MAYPQNILLLLILNTSFLAMRQEVRDEEILAMGHDRWISSFSSGPEFKDSVNGAERRFAIALGTKNQTIIASRPDGQFWEELSVHLANVTKGACRLADYNLLGSGNEDLFNSKAASLANLTISRMLRRQASREHLSQKDVWDTYRNARQVHSRNIEQILARQPVVGYSPEQYPIEYSGFGKSMVQTFRHIAKLTPMQKQHVLILCRQLVNLTIGEDPLPYGDQR
jgi:hypothetical protein